MGHTDNAIIDSMNEIDEVSAQEMEALLAGTTPEPTEEDMAQRAFDDWCDANYTTNRENFEEYLVNECDYSRHAAQQSDDGREEWLSKEYLSLQSK